jgi:hypothetical protein
LPKELDAARTADDDQQQARRRRYRRGGALAVVQVVGPAPRGARVNMMPNRNSTMTAPMYTRNWVMATNSACKQQVVHADPGEHDHQPQRRVDDVLRR